MFPRSGAAATAAAAISGRGAGQVLPVSEERKCRCHDPELPAAAPSDHPGADGRRPLDPKARGCGLGRRRTGLPRGRYRTPADLAADIAGVREITRAPVGVNLFLLAERPLMTRSWRRTQGQSSPTRDDTVLRWASRTLMMTRSTPRSRSSVASARQVVHIWMPNARADRRAARARHRGVGDRNRGR
jgi:hypothetical protein